MRQFFFVTFLGAIIFIQGAWAAFPGTPPAPFKCPEPKNITLDIIKTMKKEGSAKIVTLMTADGSEGKVVFSPAPNTNLDMITTNKVLSIFSGFSKSLTLDTSIPDPFLGVLQCSYTYLSNLIGKKTFYLVAKYSQPR